MQGICKYRSITVTIRGGKEYSNVHCDYYIQDGFLTVFRPEKFVDNYCGDGKTYFKFEEHYPIEVVERIVCVER